MTTTAASEFDSKAFLAQVDDSDECARALDSDDPIRGERARFAIPKDKSGRDQAYFCGNSLGLMPRSVPDAMAQELKDWAELAVEAHTDARNPWLPYHENFRETGARLVGAVPGEVVMMNSLTVNLHLLMASFYRPTAERYKILMERGAFPSDEHAVASQARFYGFDPDDAVIHVAPLDGEDTIREEEIERILREQGDEIALVMLGGVNYATGQLFDMERITRAGHDAGAVVGFDLAHAAGNVPMRLHEWGVDFAAWCSYKYLNSGPGAVAGAFVHENHWDADYPRYEGWWGHDPATRFKMAPEFVPGLGAEAWQLSNPPIFAMTPLKESLAIFDRVGMHALRAKSLRLHAYTRHLVEQVSEERFASKLSIITPRPDAAHGGQISIRVNPGAPGVAAKGAKAIQQALLAKGVVADFREPDIVRISAVPLYNTFEDCLRFARALGETAGA